MKMHILSLLTLSIVSGCATPPSSQKPHHTKEELGLSESDEIIDTFYSDAVSIDIPETDQEGLRPPFLRLEPESDLEWQGSIIKKQHPNDPNNRTHIVVNPYTSPSQIEMRFCRVVNTTYGRTTPFRTNYKFIFGFEIKCIGNNTVLFEKEFWLCTLPPKIHHENSYIDNIIYTHHGIPDGTDTVIGRHIVKKVSYRH